MCLFVFFIIIYSYLLLDFSASEDMCLENDWCERFCASYTFDLGSLLVSVFDPPQYLVTFFRVVQLLCQGFDLLQELAISGFIMRFDQHVDPLLLFKSLVLVI